MANISDFAALFFGSDVPLNFNINLDYDILQQLNKSGQLLYHDNILTILPQNKTNAPDRDSLYLVIPITIIYAIIFLAGIIGNVSTCIVIVRNKCMHTATNYYLFSLAISDLLLLLSGLPPDVYRMWNPDVYVFGEASCRLLGLSSETSANATVLTITAFTVERYIAICHPFLSHTMSKLSRVVKFIIAIWILALCLAIPQAIQFGVVYGMEQDQEVSSCTVKWEIVEHAFEISSFVFFVGPMTAITVLYVLIGVKLRTSRLLRPPKKSSLNSNTEQNGSSKSYKNGVSQSRAIKMLVAVAVSFFICWAPFHAQRLLAVYGKNTKYPSDLFLQVYKVLNYLSGVLYFLSTTINPFLYNIMSNKFREAFKNTIAHRCCFGRKVTAEKYHRAKKGHVKLNIHRNRAPSLGTRLTNTSSFTKVHNSEGNNNFKNKQKSRSVSAMIAKDDLQVIEPNMCHNENQMYDHQIKPINSFAGRLLKSTKAVFKPKCDEVIPINNCRNFSISRTQCESTESARSHSISNSSLQDMDEEEFTGKELATFMEQVNNHIS